MRTLAAAMVLSVVAAGADLTGVVGTMKPYIDEPAGIAGGAALRLPVTRRIAVRPEFIASSSTYYSNLLGLVCMTADFTDPSKPSVGYVVAGGGANSLREKSIDYSKVRSTVLAGVGLRIASRSGWIGGAEFRIGNSSFPLVTFYAGFRFGGNR